jgi:hypothetical protein
MRVAVALEVHNDRQSGDGCIDENSNLLWFGFFANQRLAADEQLNALFVKAVK